MDKILTGDIMEYLFFVIAIIGSIMVVGTVLFVVLKKNKKK